MTDSQQPREMLLALVNPVPGKDESFRQWYWEVHIPEVLALPGFISAQRYRSSLPPEAPVSHRYATAYLVEGSAAEALGAVFGGGLGMSEDLDLESMIFAAFTPEGTPITVS